MPTKKLNFSLSPINDNPTNVSAGNITDGYSHKSGFPTMKFSIPAQDVLLDVNNLYLSGQFCVLNADGSNVSQAFADVAKYDNNNGADADYTALTAINTSNWNGVASVIDKVVIQSKKTQTELSTIINYSAYNALKMGHQNNNEDYQQSALIRNMCAGSKHGFVNRHLNNIPTIAEVPSADIGDKFIGQFFSFKLDVALLQSQMIHLGNGFAGGLLLTLHLAPDANVFHSRFRKADAGITNNDINGVQYVLKNVKLEGKYAMPTPQDLQAYNPVITMNSRVNLMNDVVSSENANTYTPQLQMVKGVVNTFLDDNQSNNYKLNSNNFRVPLGLVEYQQAKNNIRFPNDFATKLMPNAQSSSTSGTPVDTDNANCPSQFQGDSELRLQFGRALLGGKLANHTSANISLTNNSLKSDWSADGATSGTVSVGDNTNPDLLGIAVDYSNNVGQIQNFLNQDYECKISSGVNTGRTNLPQTRANRIAIQESFIRNFSQIDLRTLQKSQ